MAKVRGIAYRVIPEDLTAVAEFELGNLDVITVPASVYSRYREDPKWNDRLNSIKGLNTYYLGFNCSRPPFDDPEIRRAVSEAIDTGKILDTFYEGRGRPAMGPVPDVLRSWPSPEPYSYNPEDSKRFIREKALSDREIEFYVTAQEDVADMAEIIQSYLAEAGLKVSIKQLEWSAYKDAVNRGEPDLFWLSWWADYPDPENFLFPLFHSSNLGPAGNRSRYVNKEVDRLIEAGQHAPDMAQRDKNYAEAERIIVHDAPWVFFWHRTDYTLSNKRVRGYYLYPIYSMDKGMEIEI